MPNKDKNKEKEIKRQYVINNRDKVNAMRLRYYHSNKEKALARVKKYRDNNPDKTKNWKLKDTFGITLEEYKVMLEKQSGLCSICLKPETYLDKRNGKIRSLSVDHNHATNKVRGLLCRSCNVGIGQFGDNIEVMKNAIKYLEEN